MDTPLVFVYQPEGWEPDPAIKRHCSVRRGPGVFYDFVHGLPSSIPGWQSFDFVAILVDDIGLWPSKQNARGTVHSYSKKALSSTETLTFLTFVMAFGLSLPNFDWTFTPRG